MVLQQHVCSCVGCACAPLLMCLICTVQDTHQHIGAISWLYFNKVKLLHGKNTKIKKNVNMCSANTKMLICVPRIQNRESEQLINI